VPAARASGASGTGLSGAGPVIAATLIGEAGDASRFRNRDHFAACNGTAPIEVSSGSRKAGRLSRRGNRRASHATHVAAVTQVRQRHSQGRACHDKKLTGGKTHREACARSGGRSATPSSPASAPPPGAPQPADGTREGNRGTTLAVQRGRITPRQPALRASHSRARHPPYDRGQNDRQTT
jgi:transposase